MIWNLHKLIDTFFQSVHEQGLSKYTVKFKHHQLELPLFAFPPFRPNFRHWMCNDRKLLKSFKFILIV